MSDAPAGYALLGAVLVITGSLLGFVLVAGTIDVLDTPTTEQPNKADTTASAPTSDAIEFTNHNCEKGTFANPECSVTVHGGQKTGVQNYVVSYTDVLEHDSQSFAPGYGEGLYLLEPGAEVSVYAVGQDNEATLIGTWTVTENGVEVTDE